MEVENSASKGVNDALRTDCIDVRMGMSISISCSKIIYSHWVRVENPQ